MNEQSLHYGLQKQAASVFEIRERQLAVKEDSETKLPHALTKLGPHCV